MAGRGWRGGRGGRGGGSFSHAPQKPFQHFPEDVNLPDVKLDGIDTRMKNLLKWGYKFQNYFKASPYFLEETTSKGSKRARGMHIERYSDKKKTMFTRDSLSQILTFNQFPKELVQGTSRRMASRKKFRWNPELETKRLDILEQQEERSKGREDKDEKEKKDEDEDEDENAEEDEGEEDFSDDDYNQNEHFDDDEDDYNDVDEGNDDEGTYGGEY